MITPQLQPELSRRDVALRYAIAVIPMLSYGSLWVIGADDLDLFRVSLVVTDVTAGLLALLLMHLRRRWPLPIGLATAVLSAGSFIATGPAAVAYVSLCTHRRWRRTILVAVVSEAALVARSTITGIDQTSAVSITTGTVTLAMLTVVGLYVRTRRELEVTRFDAEQAARRELVDQTRESERQKIAREMHDVLAHRVSLLSMLAGGLAFRDDMDRAETKQVATAIQLNAQLSLTELRTVLGSLNGDGRPEPPQPSIDDVPRLVAEVRRAGQKVAYADQTQQPPGVPAGVGRHAYRVVQEALTNARKHAPGTTAEVTVTGRSGADLVITVRNRLTAATPPPGAQLGLISLAERIDHVGGTIEHGVVDGRFELSAALPWARAEPS